ncbi:16S rRNA (guanine(966)-N(2))-methyltransferase RsmD [Corynebacterium poyangense]|uniref:16S rRNA (Guanine(966)-N(2))-methyltransferase RsmD n=1 Tax=Corynebacterium poyangense TaxID=2684405 RepID=A0A7H0SNL0_9CORY|nr:16S rRNA (guanine(966)-N(2))-methyltransferase RsmD [Corynebacterium poyangense]QNQ90135.1 16S rRNA (guanine(966)-N(2))-methyltransferase RsmD [Corynebacterium poyangense]
MAQPRIIAGIARGRKLKVPPEGTRPTSDRAKEGLFSSLQVRFGFDGKTVLDLFAGTGALGLEALSRGAEEVVLVENQRKALDTIRSNIAKVNLPGAEVVEAKASTYMASAPRAYFDMVLADPPYDLSTEAVEEILEAIKPLLKDSAVVVIERHIDSPQPQWPAGYEPTTQKLKKRTYGIARMDMAVFSRDEEG